MKPTRLQVLAVLALVACAVLIDSLFPGSGLAALAVSFPVIARSHEDLDSLANPPAGRGVSEAVPWMWYDTETYTDNVTTQINFFTTTKIPALSNMSLAGQFPGSEYFECYFVGLDVLVAPVAVRITAWADVWKLIFGSGATGTGTPTWNFILSNKEYGPFPLSTLHGTGGLHGAGGYGTTTADSIAEHATNSIPDGGFPVSGSIIIPPGSGFRIRVQWPVAVDITASRDLRINLLGTHHRKVL